MLAHTKKRPINMKEPQEKINSDNIVIMVSCPSLRAKHVKQYLEKQGCTYVDEKDELIDAKGFFSETTPANMLIGARGKENITQIQLSELTGIPRRHISDMENGRRPIGKQNALKLEKALNISYRLFL